MVSTKLKPKKKKIISKAVIPLLTVWLKVKFKVKKSFNIYIYIYQHGKGTLYIKLSMLQENSLTNQTWDVCSSMKVGL